MVRLPRHVRFVPILLQIIANDKARHRILQPNRWRIISLRVFSHSLGQTETNRHLRVTSGSPPVTDINLGQIARQAARRPNQTARI